ncbi:DUF1508 domain-containing protein [Nitrosovibrio sp. Nv17]|jgi:uncharacterized protein YegP (UPF0339 family)|uniref:YegP family protein n=1 Tax=Nitrosovibrio sp. Nv17 TaxID=1855339 RepID=UPI000908CA80|nr:DUF1508 domain-containing protein [Nitrosovibrio sp. Nv17]SFW30065.1 hypothetical protein SAMN05216414_11355 [Nitrosovibrio sp. Nv17]
MYFYLYKSAVDEQWRWNLKTKNHESIADGTEVYQNKEDAIHGIHLLKAKANAAQVFDASTNSLLSSN